VVGCGVEVVSPHSSPTTDYNRAMKWSSKDSPKPHGMKESTVNPPHCQLGHILLQSSVNLRVYIHGDLAPLERPAVVSAPSVLPESLMLKSYETFQSSFSNFSVPIFFAKFFPFSSFIFPLTKKQFKRKILFKRVTTQLR